MQVRAFERYIPLMADSTIIQFVAYPKDVQSILKKKKTVNVWVGVVIWPLKVT